MEELSGLLVSGWLVVPARIENVVCLMMDRGRRGGFWTEMVTLAS